jgi:valyl-tRNA synthetase
MSFDINECILNRNFCNKIWQATRYVLGSLTDEDTALTPHELNNLNLSLLDKWILSRLADTVTTVNSAFDSETLHYATSAIKVP